VTRGEKREGKIEKKKKIYVTQSPFDYSPPRRGGKEKGKGRKGREDEKERRGKEGAPLLLLLLIEGGKEKGGKKGKGKGSYAKRKERWVLLLIFLPQ